MKTLFILLAAATISSCTNNGKNGNTTSTSTTTGTTSATQTTDPLGATTATLNPQDSAITPNPDKTDMQPDKTAVNMENTEKNAMSYRLTVSFISKGEGVDEKAHEDFRDLLEGHTPRLKDFEQVRWGREGEIDYCLRLSELSKEQQAEFVKKVRAIPSKSALILINENASCVHKR